MGVVASLVAEWVVDATKFYNQLGMGRAALTDFAGTMSGVGRDIARFGQTFDRSISAPIRNVAESAVALAGKLETSKVAFTTLTGSAVVAERTLANLANLADRSSFTFQGIQQTSKELLASGTAAEDLLPTLRSVGDAVSAIGGSNAVLNRVVHNLAQMQSQGILTYRDLKDLAITGIPVFDILADQLGTDVAGALQLIRDKAISAEDGIALLMDGFNARFAGAMERQSQTWEGLLSTLSDVTDRALTAIGQDLIDAFDLKGLLKDAIQAVQDLSGWFIQLDASTKGTIITIGAIVAAAGPAVILFGQIAIGVSGLVTAFGLLASPAVAAVAALAGIGVALATFAINNREVQATLSSVWGAVTSVVELAASKIGGELGLIEIALSGLSQATGGLLPAFSGMSSNVLGILRGLSDQLRAWATGDWKAGMMAVVNTADHLNQLQDKFRNLMAILKTIVGGALSEIEAMWDRAIESISAKAAKMAGLAQSGGKGEIAGGAINTTIGIADKLAGAVTTIRGLGFGSGLGASGFGGFGFGQGGPPGMESGLTAKEAAQAAKGIKAGDAFANLGIEGSTQDWLNAQMAATGRTMTEMEAAAFIATVEAAQNAAMSLDQLGRVGVDPATQTTALLTQHMEQLDDGTMVAVQGMHDYNQSTTALAGAMSGLQTTVSSTATTLDRMKAVFGSIDIGLTSGTGQPDIAAMFPHLDPREVQNIVDNWREFNRSLGYFTVTTAGNFGQLIHIQDELMRHLQGLEAAAGGATMAELEAEKRRQETEDSLFKMGLTAQQVAQQMAFMFPATQQAAAAVATATQSAQQTAAVFAVATGLARTTGTGGGSDFGLDPSALGILAKDAYVNPAALAILAKQQGYAGLGGSLQYSGQRYNPLPEMLSEAPAASGEGPMVQVNVKAELDGEVVYRNQEKYRALYRRDSMDSGGWSGRR